MNVELDRKGLETLVRGCEPSFTDMDNPLVKKAGHDYSDQYGRTSWRNLNVLTDEELYEVYLICRREETVKSSINSNDDVIILNFHNNEDLIFYLLSKNIVDELKKIS